MSRKPSKSWGWWLKNAPLHIHPPGGPVPLFAQKQFERITDALYHYTNDSTPGIAVGVVQDGNIILFSYGKTSQTFLQYIYIGFLQLQGFKLTYMDHDSSKKIECYEIHHNFPIFSPILERGLPHSEGLS